MDQGTTIGNRRSRRSNVLLAASIESGGTVTAVKLRDLSAQGARIEGEPLPPEGTEVCFRRNELAVPGHIAWVRGRQAGVSFNEELQPQDVLRHIPAPKSKAQPDHRRPGFAPRALSQHEQQLIVQLGVGLAKNPFD